MFFSNMKPNHRRYSRLGARRLVFFLFVFSVISPLFISAARASVTLDKLVDVSKDEAVSIYFPEGELSVVGWEKNKIKIEGRLDKRVDSHSVVSEKGKTTFVVKMKEPKRKGRSRSSVRLFVPFASTITIESANAGLDLKDIQGDVEVSTANGDIRVQDVSKRISLTTINGNISGEGLSGRLKFNAVNGDIRVVSSSGKADIETVNGEVRVDADFDVLRIKNVNGEIGVMLETVTELSTKTINGNIRVSTGLARNADVYMDTLNGDATLAVPDDTSASFNIRSHGGGSIHNTLTADQPSKGATIPTSGLDFSVGKGGAHVEMSTLSGRLKLAPQSDKHEGHLSLKGDISDADLVKRKVAFFDEFYSTDGDIPEKYTVFIEQPKVAFDKRWFRDKKRHVTKRYVSRTKREYSDILKKQLIKSFAKGENFELVDDIAQASIVIRAQLNKLDIYGPDIDNFVTYKVFQAGDATLELDLIDKNNKRVIARFKDRRETFMRAFNRPERATRISNKRDFRMLMSRWSNKVVKQLNKD